MFELICKDIQRIRTILILVNFFLKIFLGYRLVNKYTMYTFVLKMAKEITSFRLRPELRLALKARADKEKRTLSWYIETLIEEIAKQKRIKV